MARPLIRYEPDIAGVGRVMRGPEMQAMLAARARRGQAYAQGISPVDTGDYAASFHVEVSARGTGRWADRAEARLVNRSEHATLVEWANGARVLGRTVDHIEKG